MGYDVELILVSVDPEQSFPVPADEARKYAAGRERFGAVEDVRALLLGLAGVRLGPEDALDYLGYGLNHARFHVRPDAIHVDNHLNATELLKVYKHLLSAYPGLLIHDLQSGQLHDAASYADWWTRPL